MRHGHCIGVAPLLLLAGCTTACYTGAPKGAINVIAHRGASAYAPENTLAAFAKAAELGADWFELDVRLTQDGRLICIHNDDVEKTTDAAGKAAGYTLAQLKEFDAGSWFGSGFKGERLPTLGEALDLGKAKDIGVYVEIKSCWGEDAQIREVIGRIEAAGNFSNETAAALLRLIEDSGNVNLELTRKCIAAIRERSMQKQAVIQSFSPIVCLIAVCEAPDIRTELLLSDPEEHPEQWPALVRFGNAINVRGFNANHEAMTPERLEAFHDAGKTVAVWTVDSPGQMKKYARWGVDAIITNKPDVCLDVLQKGGKR